jgi:hypothetical protein
MEPLVSIRLRDQRRPYQPGDELQCEYQLDAVDDADIQSIEASVLWHTEGKGDEDLGVHYFERLAPGDGEAGDVRALHVLRTVLPNSPLTYPGVTVKIRWCVRVRAFLRRGKEVFFEQPFVLGNVPPAIPVLQAEPAATIRPTADDEA